MRSMDNLNITQRKDFVNNGYNEKQVQCVQIPKITDRFCPRVVTTHSPALWLRRLKFTND